MADLPESLFANPVWHALRTKHRHFALSAGDACRYPADVAPFAAVARPDTAALDQLSSLLAPGESVWLIGESYPPASGISGVFFDGKLACLQMVIDETPQPPDPKIEIVRLADSNANEMLALTNLAFPGFFRSRTCEMGTYYGVRFGGELIAMGGERLKLESYTEISGVCTHPTHRGKGLAAGIIRLLTQDHRRNGLVSWLQVGVDNQRAIRLYRELGFRAVREVTLHRLARVDTDAVGHAPHGQGTPVCRATGGKLD